MNLHRQGLLVVLLALVACGGTLCPERCSCAEPARLTCSGHSATNISASTSTTTLSRASLAGAPEPLQALCWTDGAWRAVDPDALHDLVSLQELDLSRNQIEGIGPDIFGSLNSLKLMNFSNNKLDDLPRNIFKGLDWLKVLSVSHNKLHVIPFQVFAPLRSLRLLDLSHNRIVSFLHHFNRTNKALETLLLNDNRLVMLSANALEDLKDLKHLDLSNNELKSIPRGLLDSLVQLRYLNLNNNPIAYFSESTFAGLTALQTLHIGDNLIQEISPGTFKRNTILEIVYLENTKIEKISDDQLKGLKNLKTLILRNNELLKEIEPIVFLDITKIENLDISKNALTYLPSTLDKLEKLQGLNIGNNPWSCDCRMAWFATWAEKRLPIMESDLSCGPHAYPNEMVQTLQHLNCTAPRIVYNTPPSYYVLKTNALLECKYAGKPTPSITWITPIHEIFHWNPEPTIPDVFYKHPKAHDEFMVPIDQSYRVRVLSNGSLLIQNVTREDTGRYICFATNPNANVSTSVDLMIDPITMYEIKINSTLFGLACAAMFLALTLMIQLLRYIVDK